MRYFSSSVRREARVPAVSRVRVRTVSCEGSPPSSCICVKALQYCAARYTSAQPFGTFTTHLLTSTPSKVPYWATGGVSPLQVRVARAVPLRHQNPSDAVCAGRVRCWSLPQFWKALAPMAVRFSERLTSASSEQPLNMPSLTAVTPGRAMAVRAEHPAKALPPMVRVEAGMRTEVRLRHSLKASEAISVTPSGSSRVSISAPMNADCPTLTISSGRRRVCRWRPRNMLLPTTSSAVVLLLG